MSLGTLAFLVPMAAAMLLLNAALMVYRTMIDEVQARLPQQDRLLFPEASWNVSKITRLHREFYPGSRSVARFEFLSKLGFAALAIDAIVLIVFAFSNPPR